MNSLSKKRIEIFGGGCTKCETLAERAKQAADELNLEYEIVKVQDMQQIVNRGIFKTPALGIDGEVVVSGRVPSTKKIIEFLEKS